MKNLNKGFIVPALLVIIAVLAIGGGVYVYKNKKAEVPVLPVDTDVQSINQIQQQTNNQANDSNLESSTANWRTYSGVDLSFKYPSNWYLDASGSGYVTITNYDSSVVPGSDAPISSENIMIRIFTYTNLSVNETLDSWANKIGLSVKQNILVDSVKAIRGKIIYTGQEESGYYQKGESSGDYVLSIVNGKGYQIVYSPYGSKLISTFNQILSTFKFTR